MCRLPDLPAPAAADFCGSPSARHKSCELPPHCSRGCSLQSPILAARKGSWSSGEGFLEQRVGRGGGREPARIPRMVGADGADSWALGWGWNVAGHCPPSDGAGGVRVQPEKMFKKRRSRENLSSTFQPRAFNSNSAREANVPAKHCGVASSLGLKSRGQQEELEQTFGSF